MNAQVTLCSLCSQPIGAFHRHLPLCESRPRSEIVKRDSEGTLTLPNPITYPHKAVSYDRFGQPKNWHILSESQLRV